MRQIQGPRRLALAPDDVVAVVLVRNGLYYLDRFLAHHRALGIRYFVFVDNGSTDGTPERLRSEADCVVLRSSVPFLEYETLMRGRAARRHAQGHWVLFLDVDEMFDFAGSDVLGLSGLVRYLTGRGHTAMVAQMLEMFPEGPIADHAARPFAEILDAYRHYDLSAVVSHDYRCFPLGWSGFADLNEVSDDRVKLMTDGIRAKVFGEHCGISKHPLVFLGDGAATHAHPHCVANARVSDVTGVLRHYKFAGDFLERDRATTLTERGHVGEAKARQDGISRDPGLSLFSKDALEWAGIDALYRQGFLVCSEAYEAYLASRRAEGTA